MTMTHPRWAKTDHDLLAHRIVGHLLILKSIGLLKGHYLPSGVWELLRRYEDQKEAIREPLKGEGH